MVPRQVVAEGEPSAEAELLQRLRDGEDAAFGELFESHAAAVRRLALGLAADRSEAEDITAETFFRVLQALRRGSGPRDNVRAYLLTVARRVSWEWHGARKDVPVTDDELTTRAGAGTDSQSRSAEHTLITRAFTSLPERWRSVLWQTEVEGEQPAVVAPHFGLSANATAALARRARLGLRAAYLQAHLAVHRSSDGCRTVMEKLGGYTAGSVTGAEARKVRAHLIVCSSCRSTHAELRDVCSSLRAHAGLVALLVPASALTFAGSGAGAGAASAAGSAVAASAGGVGTAAAGGTGGLAAALGTKVKVGVALASTAAAGALGVTVGPGLDPDTATQLVGLPGGGAELRIAQPTSSPTRTQPPRTSAGGDAPAPDHLDAGGRASAQEQAHEYTPARGTEIPGETREHDALPNAELEPEHGQRPAGEVEDGADGGDDGVDPRSDIGDEGPVDVSTVLDTSGNTTSEQPSSTAGQPNGTRSTPARPGSELTHKPRKTPDRQPRTRTRTATGTMTCYTYTATIIRGSVTERKHVSRCLGSSG
ncbi:RNA polymerase sigma factor (sigma-70 family) [Amycolatopsis cihanbeyliensis]|uniref:RNA polymerase sigma factor (Sigma-70 family) n=2 Tax=Amycolatopsis cihanbeyliensis TaxID=1128664 RepID=A0A542DLS1_AMYCI|nr:RNA polymerase sigma factor (sigma-70 family) [Amycolatopsis cihanbeyliensis]